MINYVGLGHLDISDGSRLGMTQNLDFHLTEIGSIVELKKKKKKIGTRIKKTPNIILNFHAQKSSEPSASMSSTYSMAPN